MTNMKTDNKEYADWCADLLKMKLKETEQDVDWMTSLSVVDPDNTDVYTVEDFFKEVKHGMFTDYDGSGYYMLDDKTETNISVWEYEKPNWATHVAWYNR